MNYLTELIKDVTLETAQFCAETCSGENAPDLSKVTHDNCLTLRNEFLKNVQFNGRKSHRDIILVLAYLGKFITIKN